MSDPNVKIEIIATASTVLTDAERTRAIGAMTALPGMAYEINPVADSRTVEGLISTIQSCGKVLQGLHNDLAKADAIQAEHARDIQGLRRIFGRP